MVVKCLDHALRCDYQDIMGSLGDFKVNLVLLGISEYSHLRA